MTVSVLYRNTTSDFTGKGSRLTSLEGDRNTFNIVTAIVALQEAAAASGKTLESVTAEGDQLTFHYSDSTTDTIAMPTATSEWRGEWAAGMILVKTDLFYAAGALYQVQLAHTAASEFDPGANNGTGTDYYKKIFSFPSIPGIEISDAEFMPTIIHANSYMRCTSATGCVVVIPLNVTAPYEMFTEMVFRDVTTSGGISLDKESTTIKLNIPELFDPITLCKHATIGIKLVGPDEWDVFGLLSAKV